VGKPRVLQNKTVIQWQYDLKLTKGSFTPNYDKMLSVTEISTYEKYAKLQLQTFYMEKMF
jgi:hypothetical protein